MNRSKMMVLVLFVVSCWVYSARSQEPGNFEG